MIKMDRIGRRRLHVQQGHEYQTRVSIDFIAQSGLRASTPTVPNGASLPEYAAVNASVVQKRDLGIAGNRIASRCSEHWRRRL